jgi:hypothetical protein
MTDPFCRSLKWEKLWHPELRPVEEALSRFLRLFPGARKALPE